MQDKQSREISQSFEWHIINDVCTFQKFRLFTQTYRDIIFKINGSDSQR